MSYHIVSIDTPNCSLSCKDGQLTCRTEQGVRSLPLEDVSAILVTSFNASIHGRLLIEAAKQGVVLILCESFKPASLVLPANRSTDTALSRAVLALNPRVRNALWRRTVDAKCGNQSILAAHMNRADDRLADLRTLARAKSANKEASCARLYWGLFGRSLGETGFRRETEASGGINALLNFGYAVLLSSVLQNLFAVGLDPTWGLSHVARERATPLAYDLMEPFRPCVDWRVWQWARRQPAPAKLEVSKEYRAWIIGFLSESVEYRGARVETRRAIEAAMRSFRRAALDNAVRPYQPWMPDVGQWPSSSQHGSGAV